MNRELPAASGEARQGEVHFPRVVVSELFVVSTFARDRGLFDRHPLDPTAFTEPRLVEIYRAMVTIGETNLLIVGQYLADRQGIATFVPEGMLTQLTRLGGDPALFPHHLEAVVDRYDRRQAIKLCRQAIEKARDCTNPEGLAGAVALLHAIQPTAPVAGRGFGLHHVSEIEAEEPARDFVEGLFTEGGASVVYGESNVGKSFWVLDIAAHVATGRPWRHEAREVDRGAVVYVALEGTHGLRRRIEAMKQKGILSDDAPLYVCFSPVSLRDPAHAARLAQTVKAAVEQSGLPCRLVIIDTLARAVAGGDENSSRDMTAVVASIDAVRTASGAHVCIVHHCGKDIARGARGHSSLRAAVDTEIEIFRPEGERISTVRVTKQRDMERCEPMPFSLTVVELGHNRRGKPITSCVVKHEDEKMASKPKQVGRQASYSADAMLDYLPAANASEWAKRAKEDCGISATRFYQLKAELKKRGAYQTEAASGKLVRTSTPLIPL
jgi:hypothetical protein